MHRFPPGAHRADARHGHRSRRGRAPITCLPAIRRPGPASCCLSSAVEHRGRRQEVEDGAHRRVGGARLDIASAGGLRGGLPDPGHRGRGGGRDAGDQVGDGYAVLSDGTEVETDAVVWSVGMRASELARQISDELDHLGRVPVDRHLRALPEVFAAGDTAAAAFDAEHTVMQACQHATPLGKVAGYNAAADLLGLPLRDFTPGPYVTCLDLGAAGAVFTRGWDRRVMASGAEAKEVKKQINQWIHPPVDDASQILAAADRVSIELPFFPRDEKAVATG
ncbi:FAD-dependent oxidoreductase [Nonomuraea deserti]|uniref:FAD-dependent oxidoreductase n=1 Tax=Nonomuraea deserti TaxID=1848322 RepID=UPI00319E1DD1